VSVTLGYSVSAVYLLSYVILGLGA